MTFQRVVVVAVVQVPDFRWPAVDSRHTVERESVSAWGTRDFGSSDAIPICAILLKSHNP